MSVSTIAPNFEVGTAQLIDSNKKLSYVKVKEVVLRVMTTLISVGAGVVGGLVGLVIGPLQLAFALAMGVANLAASILCFCFLTTKDSAEFCYFRCYNFFNHPVLVD